jgi:hypothetical protein
MKKVIETNFGNHQYTNAKDVKKFLDKKIHEQISKKEMENFKFDVISAKDRKNQDFLYISLIDNGNFIDNSFNNELLRKIGFIIKESIKNNCSNLIEIVAVDEGAGQQLVWLPKDKNCFTLYERYDDVDEFSIKPQIKKSKIR